MVKFQIKIKVELIRSHWDNVIAFVGHTIEGETYSLVKKFGGHGVHCMIKFSSKHDCKETARLYEERINKETGIIESDNTV